MTSLLIYARVKSADQIYNRILPQVHYNMKALLVSVLLDEADRKNVSNKGELLS